MQQRTINIPSAQVLTLNSIPVELVPHPGAGIVLTPWACTTVLHFAGLAHLLGGPVHVTVGPLANGHGFVGILQATVQAAADSCDEEYALPPTTPSGVLAQFEDQPIMLTAAGADFTNAGGSLTVTVFYNSSRIS